MTQASSLWSDPGKSVTQASSLWSDPGKSVTQAYSLWFRITAKDGCVTLERAELVYRERSRAMLRIALIGGGSHSRGNHLPALRRYVELCPGVVELAAFCDLKAAVAESVSREYGFSACYTEVADMLSSEELDGCIAVTPIPVTAAVASQVIAAGVPLLMEKPPGAALEQTDQVLQLVAQADARVMVSMNRRFDPALRAACEWLGERPLRYIRGTMLRARRREPDFFFGTAIHCLDAVRGIAGDVRDYSFESRCVDGVLWYAVRFVFESGALGTLEIMPTCGLTAEWYELLGDECRAVARSGQTDAGTAVAWAGGDMVLDVDPAYELPVFVRNGAYGETVEFIASLSEGRAPYPALAEVRQSVELCQGIQAEAARRVC